jgi:DNA-binding response OmpR family regulator
LRSDSKSVLLVEDEVLLCWDVEEALKDEGYAVRIETTGNGGLAAIESEQRFDILVSNIKLQDGPDGWTLARRARQVRPGIPVVFVTGDSAWQHQNKGVPGSIMLSKPFDPETLKAAIASLLETGELEDGPAQFQTG